MSGSSSWRRPGLMPPSSSACAARICPAYNARAAATSSTAKERWSSTHQPTCTADTTISASAVSSKTRAAFMADGSRRARAERGGERRGELLEVGARVREREEAGLVRRRREVHASGQHGVKQRGEASALALG